MGNLTAPLEKTKWRADSVDKILNNPTYAGDIVTGKLKQALYKGVKQYKTSPEDLEYSKRYASAYDCQRRL